jgi:hypothetical protein
VSRSHPNDHAPNPAVRWFEWNGEHGTIRYYDRDQQKNIDIPLPFTFLLLDELATVRGWHDASESAIYANEVRDTRTDPLVVKAFKGGVLAEGLYKDIKDRVNTLGAQFVANCYIGFKQTEGLVIGSLRFKGAALNAWVEFRKAHRGDIWNHAIDVTGFSEGKKGRIVYRVPTFSLRRVSDEANRIAMDLDKELQAFLDSYFSRRTSERSEPQAPTEQPAPPPTDEYDYSQPLNDSDIPF